MKWKEITYRTYLHLLVAVATFEFHTLDELTNVLLEVPGKKSFSTHAPST